MNERTLPVYSLDRTQDEDGADVWFVANRRGDWIEGPFPTHELAQNELLALLTIYIDTGIERTS